MYNLPQFCNLPLRTWEHEWPFTCVIRLKHRQCHVNHVCTFLRPSSIALMFMRMDLRACFQYSREQLRYSPEADKGDKGLTHDLYLNIGFLGRASHPDMGDARDTST